MSDKSDNKPDWRKPDAWLPDSHWGRVDAPLPAPQEDTEPDPDDELLPETPPDVVAMLGFDPRKAFAEEPAAPPPEDPPKPR